MSSWTKLTKSVDTWTKDNPGEGFLLSDGFLTGWGFLQDDDTEWEKQTKSTDTWTKVA